VSNDNKKEKNSFSKSTKETRKSIDEMNGLNSDTTNASDPKTKRTESKTSQPNPRTSSTHYEQPNNLSFSLRRGSEVTDVEQIMKEQTLVETLQQQIAQNAETDSNMR
jgi:hypothetical protein